MARRTATMARVSSSSCRAKAAGDLRKEDRMAASRATSWFFTQSSHNTSRHYSGARLSLVKRERKWRVRSLFPFPLEVVMADEASFRDLLRRVRAGDPEA